MQAVQPDGIARLTFGAPADAPASWRALAQFFDGRELALPNGDWYHARFDLDLHIERA